VPEEELSLFLGLTLGRQQLPWAPLSLLPKHVPRPAGGSLALAFAFARVAVGGTSRSAGTSAIAKTQGVVVFFVGGKLAGGRQSAARRPR
jgi:hypothetical protein